MRPERMCPLCGKPMVPVCGVTDPGREWTRWHCNRCNHEETARGVREGALPREEEHAWH